MWFYIHLTLNLISIVCIILALYNGNKLYKDMMELIDDQFEALTRSRNIVRMYKEENERCWKALEVMTANYNEVVWMLEDEWKKAPQK